MTRFGDSKSQQTMWLRWCHRVVRCLTLGLISITRALVNHAPSGSRDNRTRGTGMALKTSPAPQGGGKARQIAKYLVLIKRRWPVIWLCIAVGLGLAVLDIARTPVTYRASAQVFVTTSDVKDASGLFSGNEFAQSRVQTYISVVTSPSIIEPVRNKLGLNLSNRQLTNKISVDAPLNKTLINIHITDGSAQRAAEIANAVASEFIVDIGHIETEKSATATAPATPVLKLTVIHPALAPVAPIAPQKKLMLLLGFFGGLFLGLLVVTGREWMNTRLRSPLDVEAISSLPLLGVIPTDRSAKTHPNAIQFDQTSARSEAFRVLRTNLQFVDVDKPPRMIAITSPVGREGKTSVALNLAASLAEIGFRVGLIEMDLRQPVLAQWLDLEDEIGLSSLLVGSARIDEAVQHVHGGLYVVTSGPLPPNPTELLGSMRTRAIVEALVERFDYLILDASSVLPVADGAPVVSQAAATVLVVRAEETTPENFRRAVNAVGQFGGTLAGVVVNRSSDLERRVRGRRRFSRRTRPSSKTGATVGTDARPKVDAPAVAVTATAAAPVDRPAAEAPSRRMARQRNGPRRPHPRPVVPAQPTFVSTRKRVADERDPEDDDAESRGPWLLG
jgi:succinoglycan biosynthesis transport protein ExoP